MATPSPSKLNYAKSPAADAETWTPRGLVTTAPSQKEPALSPTRGANSPKPGSGSVLVSSRPTGDLNSLSKLQPAQVRELREGFQILDRDSDGLIGREDVLDMLNQLG